MAVNGAVKLLVSILFSLQCLPRGLDVVFAFYWCKSAVDLDAILDLSCLGLFFSKYTLRAQFFPLRRLICVFFSC